MVIPIVIDGRHPTAWRTGVGGKIARPGAVFSPIALGATVIFWL
ncbi:hypothetical protein ABLE91_25640 [Aquabacter sp. CN5-332]